MRSPHAHSLALVQTFTAKCSKEVEVQTVCNSQLEKTLFQHHTMRDTLKYSCGRKGVPLSGWSDCLQQPDCTYSSAKLTALRIISPSSQFWGRHRWGTKPKCRGTNPVHYAGMCSTVEQQSEGLQRWLDTKSCFCQMPGRHYKGAWQNLLVPTPPPRSQPKGGSVQSIILPTQHLGRCLPWTRSFISPQRHSCAGFPCKTPPFSLDSKNKGI